MRPAASHAGKPDATTVARSVDREEPARVLGSIKKPKRPRTAYHFFYDFRRNEVMDAADDKSTVDNNILSRQIGEEWKNMSDDQKNVSEIAHILNKFNQMSQISILQSIKIIKFRDVFHCKSSHFCLLNIH